MLTTLLILTLFSCVFAVPAALAAWAISKLARSGGTARTD